jgi:ribosomal protein S18 acetylase RimI-like enzyme
MVNIREYISKDREQLEECYIELQDTLRAIDASFYEGKVIAKTYVDYILFECEKTNGKVFLAEDSNSIIGFVCVWANVPTEEVEVMPSEYAYISDIVVKENYRSQGIAQELLNRAAIYAKSQGAKELKLAVLAKNFPAIKTYLKFGFDNHMIIMRKEI